MDQRLAADRLAKTVRAYRDARNVALDFQGLPNIAKRFALMLKALDVYDGQRLALMIEALDAYDGHGRRDWLDVCTEEVIVECTKEFLAAKDSGETAERITDRLLKSTRAIIAKHAP